MHLEMVEPVVGSFESFQPDLLGHFRSPPSHVSIMHGDSITSFLQILLVNEPIECHLHLRQSRSLPLLVTEQDMQCRK
jgi:hypothetical protein